MPSRVPTIVAWAASIVVIASPAAAQVPAADTSAKSTRDSAPRPVPDTARSRPARQAQIMNADTVLAQACGQTSRGSAEGLLAVTFDPKSVLADRAAAAKQVGGTLAPQPGGLDNEYYIRITSGGSEQQLQALADQLIVLPSVRMVGSARCPTLPPPQPQSPPKSPSPAQTQPADSGQARNASPGQ